MQQTDSKLNTYTLAIDFNPRELIAADKDILNLSNEGGNLNLYPGYTVTSIHKEIIDKDDMRLHLILDPQEKHEHNLCPHCAAAAVKFGTAELSLEDGPVGNYEVRCTLKQQRYRCLNCKRTFTHEPEFKHPCHRITLRLYAAIKKALRLRIALRDIQRLYRVSYNIIKEIDKAILQNEFKEPDLKGVKYLAIDEHSVRKGHNYITVIFDAQSKRLLYVCEGKKKEDIYPFFLKLKETGVDKQIEGCCCDCASGFIAMFKEHLPNAVIVIDEFHCLVKLTQAIDEVRKNIGQRQRLLGELLYYAKSRLTDKRRNKRLEEIYKRLESLGMSKEEAETEIKGCNLEDVDAFTERANSISRVRWALSLGSRKSDSAQYDPNLTQMIKTNTVLSELLMLGDLCRDFWHSGYSPDKTGRYIDLWIQRAKKLKHQAMDKFCKFLHKHKEYIIYASSTGLSNSQTEGLNSAAKAYQRAVRGVKDLRYYMLKLHSFFAQKRPCSMKPTYFRKNGARFKDLRSTI